MPNELDTDHVEKTDEQLEEEIDKIGTEEELTEETEESDNSEEESEEEIEDEESQEEAEEEESEATETETEVEEETEEEVEVEEEEPTSRFKSLEQANKDYAELLKFQGKQANELGQLRAKVSAMETTAKPTPATEDEPTNGKLNAEELEDLRIENPDAYNDYMAKEQYKRINAMQAQENEQRKAQEIYDGTKTALTDFFSKGPGSEMEDAEADKFVDFFAEHHNAAKVPTPKQLEKYVKWMNVDSIEETAEKNGKAKVLKTIKNKAPKVKTLSSAKNTKSRPVKDISKLSREQAQDAAFGMTDEELDERINAI